MFVTYFFSGLIIGVLLGLAAAPFLRAWLLWHESRRWYERDRTPLDHAHER